MENLLLNKMRSYFNKDSKRIFHAESVLKYAKEIMTVEGGNENVIIASAILHDIGIHECERKYNFTAGNFQEIECPPIARDILKQLGFSKDVINEVIKIIKDEQKRNIFSSNEKREEYLDRLIFE